MVVEAAPAVTVTAEVVKTSFVAAAALTVSTCVADVIVVGEVLAAVIVGVPACVSVYVKLTLLDPLGIDSGLAGVNVTVPPDVLERVTVRVGSDVFGFPPASCRCTVIVVEATPAVTVTAEVVNTSFVAGDCTDSIWVADVIVVGEVLAAVIVGVPACVSVYVKFALLDPLRMDNGLAGVKVTVPPDVLDSVTLLVASLVFAFPN